MGQLERQRVDFTLRVKQRHSESDDYTVTRKDRDLVLQRVGFVLQVLVLMFLPLVVGWQLFFGFPLLAMPTATLVAIGVFSLGHVLRKR